MCIGAPCAVLIDDWKWLRARISKFSKGNDVIVDLVDIGNDNIVNIENIRPLLKVFGRLPPLALRCRMKEKLKCLKVRSGNFRRNEHLFV
ncbi:Tudor domain family protein [Brugia pahangi]